MQPSTKSFRVVNQRLVEDIARSAGIPVGTTTTCETEIGFSKWLIARAKSTKVSPTLLASNAVTIDAVVEALRNSGALQIDRPSTPSDYWRAATTDLYVWEDLVLTPVNVPLRSHLPNHLHTPNAVNVWVGEPLMAPGGRTNFGIEPTSYLFIVEELGDFSLSSSWFFSGVSALRLVAEFIGTPRDQFNQRVEEMLRTEDLFGRDHPLHPIEKLRAIPGVTVGTPRRVETVYKVAYMTDEQADTYGGQPRRLSDIMAHPLYIS